MDRSRPPPPGSVDWHPVPPPPLVAPSQVLPPWNGADQMNVKLNGLHYSFVQKESQPSSRDFVQDTSKMSTLNFSYCKSDRSELENSSLAQLLGSSHHSMNQHLKLSSPRNEIPTSNNDFSIMACSHGTGVLNPPVVSKVNHYGNSSGMELDPSFVAFGQDSQPMHSQSLVLHDSIQTANSLVYSSNSFKPGHFHMLSGNKKSEGSPSQMHGLVTEPTLESSNPHHGWSTQFLLKATPEITSANTDNAPSYIRRGPRVSCMGIVGELFLDENGLLGILCLCHNLRMSAAKFCEHSGSLVLNPGDAVHLENGETLARWRRLFFLNAGIRITDDERGWDWSERSHMCSMMVEPNTGNAVAPKDGQSTQSLDNSGGFEVSEKLLDGYISSEWPHVGLSALKKLMNRVSDNVSFRNTISPNLSPKLSHVSLLQPSKLEALQNMNDNHVYNNLRMPKYLSETAERSAGPHYVADGSITSHRENQLTLCNISTHRENVTTKLPLVSSNFGLSLGQPSQQNAAFLETAHAHPQMNNKQTLHSDNHQMHEYEPPRFCNPPIKEKICKSPCYGLPGNLVSSRGMLQHSHGQAHAIGPSQSQGFNGEANKGSPISLFLSHLNSFEGDTSSQAAIDVFGYSENPTSMLPNASSSVECNSCNVFRKVNDWPERTLENSNNMLSRTYTDKRVRVPPTNDSCSLSRADLVSNKCAMLTSKANDKHSFHGRPPLLGWSSPKYVKSFSDAPVEDSGDRNCNEAANYFHYSNLNHEVALLRSTDSHPTGSRGCTPSSPIKLSSLSNSYIANSVPPRRNINMRHHFPEENASLHSFIHASDFSKQNHGSSTQDRNTLDVRCCSLAMERQKKGSKEALEYEQCDHKAKLASSEAMSTSLLSYPSCSHVTHVAPGHPHTNVTGFSKSYCRATSTTKVPLCCRGDSVWRPFCCVSDVDKKFLFRLGRIKKDCTNHNQHELNDHFLEVGCNGCNSDQIKHHVIPQCLSEHLSSRSVRNSGIHQEQSFCGSKQMLHSPSFARDYVHENTTTHTTDNISTMWKDVPGKSLGTSRVNSTEEVRELQAINVIGREVTYYTANECAKTFSAEEATKEHEISNVCSGSSDPSVTDTSVALNNDNCFNKHAWTGRVVDEIVDEGSGIEKCASSDDALDCKYLNESLTGNKNIDVLEESSGAAFGSLDASTYGFNLKGSPKSKIIGCDFQSRGSPIRNRSYSEKKRISVFSSVQPGRHSPTHEPNKLLPQSCNQKTRKTSNLKRRRSALGCHQTQSRRLIHQPQMSKNDLMLSTKNSPAFDSSSSGRCHEGFHEECGKSKFKQDRNYVKVLKRPKYISLSHMVNSPLPEDRPCKKKLKPIICGNSGIIENGDLSAQSRPVKFLSLSSIMKNSRKCNVPGHGRERHQNYRLKVKKARSVSTNGGRVDYPISSLQTEDRHLRGTGKFDESTSMAVEDIRSKTFSASYCGCGSSNLKVDLRCKEIRKRNLDELTGKIRHPGGKTCKSTNCGSPKSCHSVLDSQISQDHAVRMSPISARLCQHKECTHEPSLFNSDAFCCVCGSSNRDEINQLIECSHCLIKVHQACYGILKIPRGNWSCRPCQTKSKNIVCVLCGYEGGAMTRALKSHVVVRSLLKAWNVETVCKSEKKVSLAEKTTHDSSMLPNSRDVLEFDKNVTFIAQPMKLESHSEPPVRLDLLSDTTMTTDANEFPSYHGVQNSIIAGAFDASVVQWVHMVCGLWTPGTRCPNVDTMSAFDVSGALTSGKDVVCSMCNRSGGSCIQCRISGCSTHFHAWCAHEKGLLQSEVEGIDNENVGFYARCCLHAWHHSHLAGSLSEPEEKCSLSKELSCARTEGYNGWKKEKGVVSNTFGISKESNGCIVPQEQINAWVHINGQKPCARGRVKRPSSGTEYNCRKEYTRYKHAEGWKQLVVYKSGIHALGLYTSQFIPCGAMVVEYVGEIVGQRVADKREIEYQSGSKLQYKSACYFFRIDKDHIIDATCKGGIARFVNHSCLPNCVAKIITVKNDKKVVFFAEREINPGEEITYDYNFNHEDEGKKIPCFCRAKNCRRYLN